MSERRAADDRGVALLETALIFPVLIVIFFGLTQLAFGMSTSSSATGASRTGARLASGTYAVAVAAQNATPPTAGAIQAELDSIITGVERDLANRPVQATPVSVMIYRADAAGNPAGGTGCSNDCIRFAGWNGTTGTFDTQAGTWTDPDACGTAVDTMGVRVQLLHDITAPMLSDLTVVKTTTMRLEPVTNAGC